MTLRPLEPIALSWTLTAGQPGVLETSLLLPALPLPKVFLPPDFRGATRCRIPKSGHCPGLPASHPPGASEGPRHSQNRDKVTGMEQGGQIHRRHTPWSQGLRPHPKEVPSQGPPCPDSFSPWSWKYSVPACITVVTAQAWDKIETQVSTSISVGCKYLRF